MSVKNRKTFDDLYQEMIENRQSSHNTNSLSTIEPNELLPYTIPLLTLMNGEILDLEIEPKFISKNQLTSALKNECAYAVLTGSSKIKFVSKKTWMNKAAKLYVKSKNKEGLISENPHDSKQLLSAKKDIYEQSKSKNTIYIVIVLLIAVALSIATFFIGHEIGHENGYRTGKTYGHNTGYTEGYEKGEYKGYKNGYNKGYQYGYDDGYNEGIKKRPNLSTFIYSPATSTSSSSGRTLCAIPGCNSSVSSSDVYCLSHSCLKVGCVNPRADSTTLYCMYHNS